MATFLIEISPTEWRRITNSGNTGTSWKKTGGPVMVCQTDQESDLFLPISNTNVSLGRSKRVPLDIDSGDVLNLSPLSDDHVFYALSILNTEKIVVDALTKVEAFMIIEIGDDGEAIDSVSGIDMVDTSAGATGYLKSDGTFVPVAAEVPLVLPDKGFTGKDSWSQYLAATLIPANQTTSSLGTGFYTLVVFDGSVSIAANSATITGAGTAIPGTPVTIEVTGAGTVDVALVTPCTRFQLYSGAVSLWSLFITGTGTVATRAGTSNQPMSDKMINGFGGKADGVLEASGNLVAVNRYEVVTTEADHFGAGVVIGDRVTGLTTTLDANNTVKEVSPASAKLQTTFTFSGVVPTGDHTILDFGLGKVKWAGDRGSFKLTDGTNTAEVPIDTLDTNLIANPTVDVSAAGWNIITSDEIVTNGRNTTDPITGAGDYKLVITTAGTNNSSPLIRVDYTGVAALIGKTWVVSFAYKVNSGICVLKGIRNGSAGTFTALAVTLSGSGTFTTTQTSIDVDDDDQSEYRINFDGTNEFDIQIDNFAVNPITRVTAINTQYQIEAKWSVDEMQLSIDSVISAIVAFTEKMIKTDTTEMVLLDPASTAMLSVGPDIELISFDKFGVPT